MRYRIAVGPQAGRKTMTLRNPGAMVYEVPLSKPFTAPRDGFSINAAVGCEARERGKLERVYRFMARAPIAGVPDSRDAMFCAADTDRNGVVGIGDIVIVFLDFGTDGPADGGGIVNISDIVFVVLIFRGDAPGNLISCRRRHRPARMKRNRYQVVRLVE